MLIDKFPELKNAVLNLPASEKDKMLLKMLSKDIVLMEQLKYKLLEDNADLTERVELIKNRIEIACDTINEYIENQYNYSPGYFMMDIRCLNGLINEHLSITKDKLSELDLRIELLDKVFRCEARYYFDKKSHHYHKLFNYIVARIKYILDKYDKLHEDFQFDLNERVNFLLTFAYCSELKTEMIEANLPKEI